MKKIMMFLLAILIFTGCSTKLDNPEDSNDDVEVIEDIPLIYSKFDGSVIDSVEKDNERIFAVMFDNSPKARWQAGLSEALIMYEIRVEANATRYFGIFNSSDEVELGPIRSARPYHLQLAAMYGAIYVHHGGDSSVISQLNKYNISNINGMSYDGSVFKRKSHRYAPHNSYTTISRLNDLADKLNYPSTNDFAGFEFYKENTDISEDVANYVYLNYGSGYDTEYKYNNDSKTYQRYKDGLLHLDENNEKALDVKNIIIRLIDYTYAPNGIHKQFYNTGSGKGYLISNGRVKDILWAQESENTSPKYTSLDGSPIKLNSGQTWIQWIETYGNITISE
ncbi:MAG TPA: DUF3048 domain-containing protein [Erysipelotrichaceae bacterium]|nr:DUF3048 domain-containing protein [Erysipelotrichaceae bacterium]